MERVVVVGTSCSGKTTLARHIAETLGVNHIELDAIYWKPGWCSRPIEEFRTLTNRALLPERWVADGNYSSVRDIVWGRATTVVWLNYPFRVVMWRAITRTLRRSFTGEKLFSGNRESLKKAFFSRDSILWWVITSYPRRRRQYPAIFTSSEFPGLEVIELRKPREAEEFLRGIRRRGAPACAPRADT